MTSQRVQPPQVNLRERIAALQQLNVSSRRQSSISPSSVSPSTQSSGLRDKIAQFEQKGGVPVPRGSFGLGAPPVAASGKSRRTGELYGNRIPSVSRSTSGGISLSRSTSPLPSGTFTPIGRSRSPSVDVDDDAFNADHSPVLSALPSSPSSSGLNSLPNSPSSSKQSSYSPVQSSPNTSPRKDYFTHALQAARRNSLTIDAPRSFGRFPEASSLEPLSARSVSQPVFVPEDGTYRTPTIHEDSAEPYHILSPEPSAEDLTETSISGSEPAVSLDGELSMERHVIEEPTSLHSHDASGQDESIPEIGKSDATNTSATPEDASSHFPVQVSSSSDEREDSLLAPSDNPLIHAPAIRVFPSDEDEMTAALSTTPTPRIALFLEQKNTTMLDDPEDSNSEVVQMDMVDQDQPVARLSITKESPRDVLSSPDPHSADATVPANTSTFASSFAEPLMVVLPSSEIISESHTRSLEEVPSEVIPQVDQATVDNGLSFTEVADNGCHEPENGASGIVNQAEFPIQPPQDIPIIIASSPALDIRTTDEECNTRQRKLSYHAPSLRTLSSNTPTLGPLDSPQSQKRENMTPIINIITPTDAEIVITSIAGRSSGSSSPHKLVYPENETLDLLQDYGRLSQALDLDSAQENYTTGQSPSTPPSRLSPTPSTAPPLDPPGSPSSHDRPRSAPIINVITPIDVRTPPASPGLAVSSPSTLDSQGSSPPKDVSESSREFGKVSLHMYSHSYSHPHRSLYPEPEFASSLPRFDDSTTKPVAFSAVVHQKVTEIPASTLSPLRERKQISARMARMRGGPSNDLLSSVDPAELQLLVQDAVLLEKMLEEGDHPREYQPATARPLLETTLKNTSHPDRNGSEKKSKSSSKKGESRYRPIFHRALSSPSATKTVRSRSIDAICELRPSSPGRPRTAEPFGSDTTTLTDQQAEELPTKSPPRRYLTTIRKLAGNAGIVPAIFPRKSHSTSSDFSSEESTVVDTQPDHVGPYPERRNRLVSSHTLTGSSLSIELAHKKNAALARASSFADKLLKRTRTKSSSTGSVSEAHDPPTQAPMLPPLLMLSVSDPNSSLAPPVPPIKDTEDRRGSLVSRGSSTSSSPLDKLFDSFPSVPEATPTLPFHRRPAGQPPLPFSQDEKNIAVLGPSALPQRRGRYDPQQASLPG